MQNTSSLIIFPHLLSLRLSKYDNIESCKNYFSFLWLCVLILMWICSFYLQRYSPLLYLMLCSSCVCIHLHILQNHECTFSQKFSQHLPWNFIWGISKHCFKQTVNQTPRIFQFCFLDINTSVNFSLLI